jgi:hypothetical protein
MHISTSVGVVQVIGHFPLELSQPEMNRASEDESRKPCESMALSI